MFMGANKGLRSAPDCEMGHDPLGRRRILSAVDGLGSVVGSVMHREHENIK